MLHALDAHLLRLQQHIPANTGALDWQPPPYLSAGSTQEHPSVPAPRPRSPAQIEASRRNGALSKGPRTPSGKEIAKMNGVTHGIFSRIARPGDDGREYARLYDQGVRELEREFPVRTMETEALIARSAHLRVQLARIYSVYNHAGLGILRHPDAAESMAPVLNDIDGADAIEACRFRSADSPGRPPAADVERVYTAMAMDARRTLADELRRARLTHRKNAEAAADGPDLPIPRRAASRGAVIDVYRALARDLRPIRVTLRQAATVRDVLACRATVEPACRRAWQRLQEFIVVLLRRHASEVDRRRPAIAVDDAQTVALFFSSLQSMALLQLYETRTANALRNTLDRLRELNGFLSGEPTHRRRKRATRRAKYIESHYESPAASLIHRQPDSPASSSG